VLFDRPFFPILPVSKGAYGLILQIPCQIGDDGRNLLDQFERIYFVKIREVVRIIFCDISEVGNVNIYKRQ